MDPNAIKITRERLREIMDIDPVKYLHLEELTGEYGFIKANEILNISKSLAERLSLYDLKFIPISYIENLNRSLDYLILVFRNIRGYRTNAHPDREELTEELLRKYKDFFENSLPIISFYSSEQPSLQNFKELLNQAEDFNNQLLGKSGEVDKNINSILKKLSDASEKAGITAHSKVFSEQAEAHEKKAKRWLGATIFSSSLLFGFIFYILIEKPFDDITNNFELLQLSLLKIIAFSLMSYLIILCVKNYNAHRHNYIVNTFKKNALATFQTFIISADDLNIKNTIILETTRAIFSQNSSGYLKHESDDSSPNRIIEVVRDMKSVVDGK